jgi:hypothetical protein
MHIPPTLQGSRSDDLSASATGAILDLCSEFQVDYLVCGHVHDHLELIHNSTTVVIDGCGGGSLRGPSSAVHYLEFTIRDGGLTFEPVALARDNMILAKGDYLLHVSIPRYRWWFVLLASVLVLREIHSLRKMRQAKRPTTALASP